MVNMSDIDIWSWRLNEEEGEMSCIKKKKDWLSWLRNGISLLQSYKTACDIWTQ